MGHPTRASCGAGSVRHIATLCLLIWGLLPGWLGAASPRYTGAPVVQIFTDRELVGSPQTRHIAVSPIGLVYVASTQGLAEYDGVSWRLIPKTEGLIVHNVSVDSQGQVWYAAKGQFGRLVPDERGLLRAEPWQTRLPMADQTVGHVLNMAVHGRDVYFVTQGPRSFIAHVDAAGGLHTIGAPLPAERFVNVFVRGEAIYALTTAASYRIEREALVPAPEGQALVKLGVQSLWPRREGGSWVVSTAGLRIWNGNDAPLVSDEVTAYLDGGRVMGGCPLGEGTFALGTEQKGLLLIRADGRIFAHYDEDVGLGPTSNRIESMTRDFAGGLWLALYSGITRLQVQTPAAIHNLTIGLHGRVECFAYYQGSLHVGTSQGVFIRDPETGKFVPLKNAGVDAWAMAPVPEGLIVAGDDLRLIRPDGTVDVIESERLLFRSLLLLPRDPDRFVASTGPGQLRIYHRVDGKWQFEAKVTSVRDVLFDLCQDDEGWLWGSADNRRSVARLDWRAGVNPAAVVESFGPEQGLPVFSDQRRNLGVFLLGGEIEVTSNNGLWKYDAATNHFVREDRVKGFDPAKWSRAYPLADGSLWLACTGGSASTAIARRTGPASWQVEPLPYMGFEAAEPRVVFDDASTQTIWLGYPGLTSYDKNWQGERFAPPETRLRSIATTDGRILWGGAGPMFSQPLSYAQNSLRFDFAAAAFQSDTTSRRAPEYRTRLSGLEPDWSPWEGAAHREYSRLPPGDYSFAAQARDAAGNEGPATHCHFTILPPWWRTWWAYALYTLAAGLAVVGLIRFRTNTLEVRAARLEGEVASRTEQLARQNTELIRLHKLDLDEKAAARLELLRYQLNPHFLFNTLASISAALPLNHLAREMVQRLSEFCRLTLHRSGDQEWTTLGEELRLIRVYLEIDKCRWGELLLVDIDCPADLDASRLPQFLLLPLVENALKYGHATSPDRVEIRLAARRRTGGGLVLTVANTGSWINPTENSHVSSLGIGLDNLRERLTRYYPGEHTFTFSHGGGWVTATLNLGKA